MACENLSLKGFRQCDYLDKEEETLTQPLGVFGSECLVAFGFQSVSHDGVANPDLEKKSKRGEMVIEGNRRFSTLKLGSSAEIP